MSEDKEIKDILKRYKEYLETEEAKEHLQIIEKEKKGSSRINE